MVFMMCYSLLNYGTCEIEDALMDQKMCYITLNPLFEKYATECAAGCKHSARALIFHIYIIQACTFHQQDMLYKEPFA